MESFLYMVYFHVARSLMPAKLGSVLPWYCPRPLGNAEVEYLLRLFALL